MEKEPLARFLALQNALKFNGTANPKALIGAMIKEHPEYKKDMGALQQLLQTVVKEVNTLSLEEQEKAMKELNPEFFQEQQQAKQERKEQRKQLPLLKNAEEGKVVTRIPPEPSKYNHLGHALSFLINYLYAKKYKGKCILRFEDTNPEKAQQEYVDAMKEDILEYLGIQPDEILYVSDHMERFYESAEHLIQKGHAYVDGTSSEEMSKQRRDMKESAARNKTVEENLAEWQEMREGARMDVLRLKIDMQHKNAVMRDPVIMRCIHESHYRHGEKYKVWPMYDFENSLEDSWTGITHVLRSNEFADRIELHNHIKDLLKLPKQEVQQYGRFNIVGSTTKGREIRELIESGKMIGWDDPRLITLRALRRRGIVRQAYYDLATESGMSKTQTNLDFGVIAAINRRILDEEANRYSFVKDPVEIHVKGMPAGLASTELKLHPHKARGGRKLQLSDTFMITPEDKKVIDSGKVVRFIDTANVQQRDGAVRYHSTSIEEYKSIPKEQRGGLIHFLPIVKEQTLIPARVFLPDATYADGLLEPTAKNLAIGTVVQLERYCFARLDQKNEVYTFWYTHD